MLKKKINGAWSALSTVKKKINGAWANCSSVKKKINGAWSVVWGRTLLEWTYSGAYFSKNSAYATADGDIVISCGKPQVGGGQYAQIWSQQVVPVQTIYVDYSCTVSGTNPYGYYFTLALGHMIDANSSAGYGNPVDYYIGSARSGTAMVQIANGSSTTLTGLSIRIWTDSVSTDSGVTLYIHKIYSDSVVYYWNTKTIR